MLNVVVTAAEFVSLGDGLPSSVASAGACCSPGCRGLMPCRVGQAQGLPASQPGPPSTLSGWCSEPGFPFLGCSYTQSPSSSFPPGLSGTTHRDEGYSCCCQLYDSQTLNSWGTAPSNVFPFVWTKDGHKRQGKEVLKLWGWILRWCC